MHVAGEDEGGRVLLVDGVERGRVAVDGRVVREHHRVVAPCATPQAARRRPHILLQNVAQAQLVHARHVPVVGHHHARRYASLRNAAATGSQRRVQAHEAVLAEGALDHAVEHRTLLAARAVLAVVVVLGAVLVGVVVIAANVQPHGAVEVPALLQGVSVDGPLLLDVASYGEEGDWSALAKLPSHPSVISPVWMTSSGLNPGRMVEVNSRKLCAVIKVGFFEMCVSVM